MRPVTKSNIPIYKEGVRAGYDTSSRRYRDVDGKILSKNVFRAVQNLPANAEGFGWSAKPLLRSPVSEAFEKYDLLLTGARRLEEIITYEDRKRLPAAQPIPSDVRAAMNLAEFYCKTEGDVFQHIEAPIDVAVNDIEINCPDTGLKRDLEELYSQDFLDMWEVLYQAWMCTAQFGTAFPLEVYDQKQPQKVILLPPRFVWVGYYVSYGEHVGGMVSPYALNPLDESQKWTQDLVDTTIMPMTYNSFAPQWNEQIMKGAGIPLNPDFLHPIRAKAYNFNRYPQPPLSRAYRAISTRVVFEEMVRATIEGYRNQLWVFLLGTSEHPPSPQEMAALKATLEGMAGERTGYLAWRGDLTVEQHTPKPLEQMLSSETFQAFTLQIFRMLGANVHVTTGNQLLSQRSGDSALAVDLSLWLKRLEFMRAKILHWEQHFRSAYVRRQNSSAMAKANEKTTVRFSRSLLEVSDLIEKELRPLYSLGLLSRRTPVEKAGYNFDQELAYKKDEKKDEELFLPPPAFNQTTMGGGGGFRRNTTQTLPAGRPPDNVNSNQLTAALFDEPVRQQLFSEVYAAFREMILASDHESAVSRFIQTLREIDERQLTLIAQQAYTASGGVGNLPAEWAGMAVQFVNSFTSGFEQALKGALAQGESLEKFLYRAMLYPQEGYKMAVINGQSYAMRERGARHWRRVLHPELTESGPCELCVADSLLLHAIEEPFIVLHPNEACSKQDLWIQYFTGGIPSIEVPIPTSPSGFDEYARALGKLGKSQTRRKRV